LILCVDFNCIITTVLEPISSTVESIPIYKLSRGFETGSIKEYIDKTTLLTGNWYSLYN